MSNHDGSYMLNAVLQLLIEQGFFKKISKEDKNKFICEIIAIGAENDCNNGEILDILGPTLNFCYYCEKPSDNIDEDENVCPTCLAEWA